MKSEKTLPKDGIEGLKENWKSDLIAGFMIFLLAMPLSLGIADQSKFPPVFGLVAAIIGGMVVSLFAGSRLTIKGPAAGLAPIVGAAVVAFSDDPTLGWKMTCGAIVVASVLQVLLGIFKLGKMSDFFPASAIHGMLAAIGILIFSKQIHNLLGIPGKMLVDEQGKALSPLGLLSHIPQSIAHLDWQITLIGVLSLIIVFGMPFIKNKYVKLVPVPVVVLALAIPLALAFGLQGSRGFAMIKIGDFIDQVGQGLRGENISFEGFKNTIVFAQYVLLFSLIGSIESLLTVKAIDGLDPYHRKSNSNKDIIAVGIGNLFSGFLGGLPMISEVARSSANVSNGAKTRWSNFFHGVWLLLAVLLIAPFLEMIPKTALAALLLGVAYRLAAPRHFINTSKIGLEQLAVFIVTIVFTLVEDLLIGVISGIVLKFAINIFMAGSFANIFKAKTVVTKYAEGDYSIQVIGSLTFSNFISFQKLIYSLPTKSHIKLDLENVTYIGHGAIEQLRHLEEEMHIHGGSIIEYNKIHLGKIGKHRLSALRLNSKQNAQSDLPLLNERAKLAKELNFKFVEYGKNEIRDKFSKFYLYKKMNIVESVIIGQNGAKTISIVDFTGLETKGLIASETQKTIFLINTYLPIPNFVLEIEEEANLLDEGKDMDFAGFQDFSEYFLLKGQNEHEVRKFFTPELIRFFEDNKDYLLEAEDGVLLVRPNADLLTNYEMKVALERIQAMLIIMDASISVTSEA